MVGAIADWFAVTALFKHPLGLPIPHTALIPRRKEMLGRGLAGVRGRELPAGGDHPRRGSAPPRSPSGSATGCQRAAHARRVVAGGADIAAIGLGKVEDEDIAEFVETVLVPRFREEPISPIAGSRSSRGRPRRGAPRGRRPAARGGAPVAGAATRTPSPRCVGERAPWWAPERAQRARSSTGCTPRSIEWIADIRSRPAPPRPRPPWTRCSRSSATDLLHDPETQERAEALKAAAPRSTRRCRPPGSRCGTRCATRCSRRCRTSDGPLAERLERELVAFGGAAPRRRADARRGSTRCSADVVVFAVIDRYGAS